LVFAVIAIASAAVYFATIVGQLPTTAVTEIDYQGSMVAAIGATIVLTVVGFIGVGIANPRDANQSDQWDKDINRFGEYVGGTLLAFGMIVPFGMAMAEAPHFWIANAMYLAFVLSAFTSSVVKVVAYRRGL
jgi:hypothetical protein